MVGKNPAGFLGIAIGGEASGGGERTKGESPFSLLVESRIGLERSRRKDETSRGRLSQNPFADSPF